MPKKAAHKKRSGRPVRRKKSFFESLFSFSMPKLFAVIAGAVFLTLMFQFNSSSEFVLGTSTKFENLTQTQFNQLAADYPYRKYVRTMLIRDKNGNGLIDDVDTCLPKKYSFKMNGKQNDLVQNDSCAYYYTINKSHNNCVEVRFINTLSNYTFTGIEYTNNKQEKTSKSKTVSVCGTYGSGEGVRGAFKYSQAKFLLKAK